MIFHRKASIHSWQKDEKAAISLFFTSKSLRFWISLNYLLFTSVLNPQKQKHF